MRRAAQLLLCTCLCFLLTSESVICSHIVGGEMSYTFLSYNQDRTVVNYEVTLKLYRDPKGIAYTDVADFGVFVQDPAGEWSSYQVVRQVPISDVREVSRGSDPCRLRSLNEERLQTASYIFTISLEVGKSDYLIVYQKGFRNFTINNIIGGGVIGSIYDILITPEALRSGNSSPSFVDLPPIFICAGYDINVTNAAIDADGDEIVYSFCSPLYSGLEDTGPGSCGSQDPDPELCLPPYVEVAYLDDYDASNPLGNPLISIDNQTGTISGVPALNGSYVVAVCVEEYRGGVLLSRTRRDFEFNVVNCVENLFAKVYADEYLYDEQISSTDSIAYFESCDETNFTFINQSGDQRFIQNYKWQFYNESNELLVIDDGPALRDYQVNFPGPGRYTGLMILNEGIACPDTAHLVIEILPEIKAAIEMSYDTCVAGPVAFGVQGDTGDNLSFSWTLGDGNLAIGKRFEHQYVARGEYVIELEVEDDFGCVTAVDKQLSWYPFELIPPDTIRSSLVLCPSDSLLIEEKWVRSDGIYFERIPSFMSGCDSLIKKIELTVLPQSQHDITDTICMGDVRLFANQVLNATGVYMDTLESETGCDSLVLLDLVVAENLTRINLEEELVFSYGSSVVLEAEVRGERLITSEWFKEGEVLGTDLELTYLVTDDEWIFFESMNELFCVAIDSVFIRTEIDRQVFIPNAISPNGDGVNDIFNIGGSLTVASSQISIYDRWGKLVYEGPKTDERLIESGWEGMSEGRPVASGVYVYVATVEYVDGQVSNFKGEVSVIR